MIEGTKTLDIGFSLISSTNETSNRCKRIGGFTNKQALKHSLSVRLAWDGMVMNLFKKISVLLILLLANLATVEAAVRSYDVEGIFYEPMTQNIGNTVFTGTFDWDADADTLSNLMGVMNSSMYTMDQTIDLNYQLATSMDQNGVVTASVFLDNSTDVFSGGGTMRHLE